MTKVKRFEDLRCWQEARSLVKEIYLVCEQGKLCKDFDTKSQLKRAALSTMNNIAEGFGKYSAKEFIRYLDIATNSASEVKSILYVLGDLSYLDLKVVEALQNKTETLRSQTLGLIKYLIQRNAKTEIPRS